MTPLVLTGHKRKLNALRFDAAGRLLSASADKTARVWDPARPKAKLILDGHFDEVNDILSLPDGRVITASSDCGVRVFTGSVALLIKGHTSAVRSIAVSADGKRFATSSDDGSVRVFASTGKPSKVLRGATLEGAFDQPKQEPRVTAVKDDLRVGKTTLAGLGAGATARGLVGEDTVYVGASDGTVKLVRLADQAQAVLVGHEAAVTHVAVSPDASLLASADDGGVIRVWKVADAWAQAPRAAAKASVEKLWSVTVDGIPDSRFDGDAVWVGLCAPIVEVDLASGQSRRSLGAGGQGEIVHFSAKSVVFAASSKTATLVDRASGTTVFAAQLEGGYVRPHWVPDGAPLAWVSQWRGHDTPGQIGVIDHQAQTLTMLGPTVGANERMWITRDGARLLVGVGAPGTFLVWDVRRRVIAATLTYDGDEEIDTPLITRDGARLIIGTRDGRAHLYDARTYEFIRELVAPKGGREEFGTLYDSPTSDRVVACGGSHAHLFATKDGKRLARLFDHEKKYGVLSEAVFSPDGARIVATMQRQVGIFDGKTGAPIATHTAHNPQGSNFHVRLFADGAKALTWATSDEDHSLRAWDVQAGAKLWANLGVGGARLSDVAFAANGRCAAVTARGWDKVRVIDLATGATIADLPTTQDSYPRPASVSADGTQVAIANGKQVELWRLSV